MITHIHLQNYRSFVDAEVDLAPFTLVLGANGAGKTNFLQAFVDCGPTLNPLDDDDIGTISRRSRWQLEAHFNGGAMPPSARFLRKDVEIEVKMRLIGPEAAHPGSVELFRLVPEKISAAETVIGDAFVAPDGSGTTQTLESLKNGDQEVLFNAGEAALKAYVPEIEKLSFANVDAGKKQIQVRERGIQKPVPADRLSEGTRFIIALLAIIHQPVKPPVICLEDVDRGMHPRVFEQMVRLMQRIAREQDVQIIATTHNPYLVDCFQEEPEAVVIVEKTDGASTLTTLAQKLEGLDYDKVNPAEMPLGSLWFSGFVGGVPDFLRPARK